MRESGHQAAYYASFQSNLLWGLLIWGLSPGTACILALQKKVVRIHRVVSQRESCRPLFRSTKILTITGLFILNCLQQVHTTPSTITTLGLVIIFLYPITNWPKPKTHTISLEYNCITACSQHTMSDMKFNNTIHRVLETNPIYELEEFLNLNLTCISIAIIILTWHVFINIVCPIISITHGSTIGSVIVGGIFNGVKSTYLRCWLSEQYCANTVMNCRAAIYRCYCAAIEADCKRVAWEQARRPV